MLTEQLSAWAKEKGNAPCVTLADTGETLSYRQVDDSSGRIAEFLRQHRIGKGHRVAIVGSNRLEYVPVYYGIWKAGATVVLVNSLVSSEEITRVIEFADVSAIFTEQSVWKTIAVRFTSHDRLIVIGFDFGRRGSNASLERLGPDTASTPLPGRGVLHLEQALAGNAIAAEEIIDESAPALISFTSGSTGTPKGVVLTHRNITTDCRAIGDWIGFTSEDRFLGVQHFFYIDHVIWLHMPLMFGGTVVCAKTFSRSRFWHWVAKYHVTVGNLVPTMINILMNPPVDVSDLDLSELKHFLFGGEPSSPGGIRRFEEHYGVPLFEGYGLTECTCVSTFNVIDRERRKRGSVGKPLLPGIQRVVDEAGRDCGIGEIGEIVIGGDIVMKGYFRQPELTEKTVRNGWLLTGDLGYRDKDGFFHVAGRKKDLIIRGAEKIIPDEINAVLTSHPKVAEAATIGMPDPIYGEEIVSLVSPKHGMIPTEVELIEYCSQRLIPSRTPKRVIVMNELSKTASSKVDKKALRGISSQRLRLPVETTGSRRKPAGRLIFSGTGL
jgi:long-chain acyl-CoA synthetase